MGTAVSAYVRAGVASVAGLAAASATSLAGAGVSFQSLGTSSPVYAVSGDGTTAGGNGFVWTQGAGPTPVAFRVNGISHDGSVLVGRQGTHAVRSIGGATSDLNTFGSGDYSAANAVSGDGSVVVGNAFNGDFDAPDTIAFRWTNSFGSRNLPGCSITGGTYEGWGALGASADGSVIVGNHGYSPRAFMWTGSGVTDIFPGAFGNSSANGVSGDGLTVVGSYRNSASSPSRAARWTAGSGALDLDLLSGGTWTDALAISGNASLVVGTGDSAVGQRAVLWSGLSAVAVQDYLTAAGITSHFGWTLTSATAVSADGLTFVGLGINPDGGAESWIVTIPAPASVAVLAPAVALFARRRRA